MRSRLQRYLASLPSGLASFEGYRAKGSLVRESLALRPLKNIAALPRELAAYVEAPPLASSWVPEAHYVALSLAMADEHGLDREGFRQFWREVMHKLTDGTYSVLLGMVHPETLLRGTAARWAHFHEGTRVSSQIEDGRFTVLFEAPTGLFDELLFDGYEGVLQGLIDRSRKPKGRAELGEIKHEAGMTRVKYLLGGW
jgi:hypothetical protein